MWTTDPELAENMRKEFNTISISCQLTNNFSIIIILGIMEYP